MKRIRGMFFAIFVIVMALEPSTAQLAFANNEEIEIKGGPDVVPWPWGLEMPFPWYGIQGVWITRDSASPNLFVFKMIKKNNNGDKQLHIRHLNALTCKTLASGFGVENDRVVTGQMSGPNRLAYRITLSAFSESDAQRPALDKSAKVHEVMVASLTLLQKYKTLTHHTQLEKLSDKTTITDCRNLKY